MLNTSVPAAGGAMPVFLPSQNVEDLNGLARATAAFDAIRADAERELIDHVRSRHDLEVLIERLIAGLDLVDADDEDKEPYLSGSNPEDCDREGWMGLDSDTEAVNEDGTDLDAGEGDGLEHGELDPAEYDLSTADETYGRGWDEAAVAAVAGERLFSDAGRPGVFISWKAGRCTSAAFVPCEGRAQA